MLCLYKILHIFLMFIEVSENQCFFCHNEISLKKINLNDFSSFGTHMVKLHNHLWYFSKG